MRIKTIHLDKFKRFTNLTICNIPPTTKLVVLVGPNGCGKSSIFDAFKAWYLSHGYNNIADNDYCKKDKKDSRKSYDLVTIDFHSNISEYSQEQQREFFYFRTAYRNSPKISLTTLKKLKSPLEHLDDRMMISNDATVEDNYQRLISETLKELYNTDNDNKNVKKLRNELLDKIRIPLSRMFPDLELNEIGLVTEKAEFYFSKGISHRYEYSKLSAGEKAAFDLVLDMIIKGEFYKNTIFCIDEPENHIHTSLQARLLNELFQLIPHESQLWIATHSFGMLKEAKRLSLQFPNEVIFLNFDGYDFDEGVVLEPSQCDTTLWNKMLEITLDNYSSFFVPETIVFCEGTSKGRKRKDFDASCYTNIFQNTHPNTLFYSLGGCNTVEEKDIIIDFIKNISPNSKIVRVIDRDDRSDNEVNELLDKGIKVLSLRHIESYILDDEVLKKWCKNVQHPDKEEELISLKKEKIDASISRGNPADDIKSASNEICIGGKKLLGLTQCGSLGEYIMRDTLAPLITPDMEVYKLLSNDIFG